MELTKEQIEEIVKDTDKGKELLKQYMEEGLVQAHNEELSQEYMEENDLIPVDRLIDIKTKLDKAQEDETPFLAINEDKLHVIGDPNRIQRKKFEYDLKFRFPKDIECDGKIVGNYKIVTRHYKNVTINPQNDLRIVEAIIQIEPFFRDAKEGQVTDYTPEDLRNVVTSMSQEVITGMYNIVAGMLDIKPELTKYMIPFSMIEVFEQLIVDFPEVFNEADAFFGISSAEAMTRPENPTTSLT